MLTPDYRPKIDWDGQRSTERQCRILAGGLVVVALLTWWLAESAYNPVGPVFKLMFSIMDPVYKFFL